MNKNIENKTFKSILNIELIIIIMTLVMYISLVTIISYIPLKESYQILLISIPTIYIITLCFILLKIEQIVGYFKCSKCRHKYMPSYFTALKAMHIGRTRYLKCPKCGKRSWSRKVIN